MGCEAVLKTGNRDLSDVPNRMKLGLLRSPSGINPLATGHRQRLLNPHKLSGHR